MSMSIAEVSERFNLTQDTLRYYERIGLIPPVNRTKSGVRSYTEEDCKWIDFIKCMRQSAGLPVEMLSKYVELFQQGDATLGIRKNLLIVQRIMLADKIEELAQTLIRLDDKIMRYEQMIVRKEKSLRSRAELCARIRVESMIKQIRRA